MFIRPEQKSRKGWTLAEMMVATGVFSISGLALATIFLFCIRSFAAMTNYATLDKCNRHAMDLVTAEMRQAQKVLSYASNATSTSLTIQNGDGANVTHRHPQATELIFF
jgi:type II secretory pathway component PulJ